MRSWPYLAHTLVLDAAALDRQELLLWDDWGAVSGPDPYSEDLLRLLDRPADVTARPDPDPALLEKLLSRPEFRIPPVLTSLDPNGGPPRQVRLATQPPLPPPPRGRR